jgi:hypothetical protein
MWWICQVGRTARRQDIRPPDTRRLTCSLTSSALAMEFMSSFISSSRRVAAFNFLFLRV